MEDATFCCLFHEITLSTLNEILLSILWDSHGAKFQTVKNFYKPNMQICSRRHFRWMTKYILSQPNTYRAYFLFDIL
jgi:hypothetical protein